MANLLDFIFQLEPYAESSTATGAWVLPLPTATGTATCGVVGALTLPVLTAEGTADWKSFGLVTLPALTATGSVNGYHPAWGDLTLPGLACEGTAHVVVASQCLLPPVFAVGYTGVTSELRLPAVTAYGVDNSFNRTASGALSLPALTVAGTSYACDLDKPITNGATSAAVVNLLQQGNVTLVDAALSLTSGCATDDAKALALVRSIADLLVYTSDGAGIGDRWSCALVTWMRRYGDCEDGAILIHGLLLAAGVNPNRIRTAFGAVLSASLTEVGHAWCMYRREVDEEWIPLDWTLGAAAYSGAIHEIRRQIDQTGTYVKISYILTNETFYAVNDLNYIARLAANRSVGSAVLPILSAAGQTGQSARGAITLFAGTLATTLSVSGQAGARASLPVGLPSVDGEASQVATSRGACVVPALAATGAAGAQGVANLPRLVATGQCGLSGRADVALPVLALAATGTAAALVAAELFLPRATVAGMAGVGAVSSGEAPMPALRVTGRAAQGPVGRADVTLPRMALCGLAMPLSVGVGDCELPLPVVRAHGGKTVSWAEPMTYNPERWT